MSVKTEIVTMQGEYTESHETMAIARDYLRYQAVLAMERLMDKTDTFMSMHENATRTGYVVLRADGLGVAKWYGSIKP